MLQEIKLFLLVLSIVYLVRFLFELTIRLFQENPEAMRLTKVEQISQLITISYIITYFLI